MSSNALSTVLFPEPESPVRMTSWRASRLAVCFTGRGRSVFYPALMGAGDAHIFAVFCDGAAGPGDGRASPFLGDLIFGQRVGSLFFPAPFFGPPLYPPPRPPPASPPPSRFPLSTAPFHH